MTHSTRVTVLVENTAFGRGVQGEHGLAFWIESGPNRVLFDTGQTPEVLLHNADCLGIDLASASVSFSDTPRPRQFGGFESCIHSG